MITEPVSCPPNLPLVRAVEKMRSIRWTALWWSTATAHCSAWYSQGRPPEENNYGYVKDIMHPPLLSTSPDSDIISVLKALQNATTSNMPVVDADGKLEGLITKSSLVSTMSTQFLDTDGEGLCTYD